jgi:Flp pilus assembly protein TadG
VKNLIKVQPGSLMHRFVGHKRFRERFSRALSRFSGNASGGVMVTFALSAVALCAVAALAINATLANKQRSYIQAAADTASLAAVTQFALSNVTQATIQQVAAATAQVNLSKNSFNAQPDDVSSSVDMTNTTVTVTIRRYIRPQFMTPGGAGANIITASATSKYRGSSSPICVLVLDPSASSAFNAFGNSNIVAPTCAIVSNSNSATGLSGTTNKTIQSAKACSAGGWTGSAFAPSPISDCPVIADPLASRAPPPNVHAACDQTDYSVDPSNAGITLQPGVYCGGINIKKATAMFAPGDYIIRGGGLTVNAGGSIYGVDVGFYLTGGAVLDAQPNSGISLSAPSSSLDPMVGLAIWEDPNNNPAGSPATHRIWSDNSQNLHGTVYFPQGKLSVAGNANVGGAAAYTIIVARNFDAFQSANIVLNANYSMSTIPVPAGFGKSRNAAFLTK